jgi:hypothetical protein
MTVDGHIIPTFAGNTLTLPPRQDDNFAQTIIDKSNKKYNKSVEFINSRQKLNTKKAVSESSDDLFLEEEIISIQKEL